jgi:hypothetical protein
MQCGEESTPKIDVFSFTLILFEIVADLPAFRSTSTSEELGKLPVDTCERIAIPRFVPEFVSVLIESRLSANPRDRPSFDDISDVQNKNSFRIADGVDSNEVCAFRSFVQSSEMGVK